MDKIAYTIISINDRAEENKADIRAKLDPIPEVTDIHFVNGNNARELVLVWRRSGINKAEWTPKVGEAGIWLSQYACWQWLVDSDYEYLLVFEDDAKVSPNFRKALGEYLSETPEDMDFFSLAVPENQRQDFGYRIIYDENGEPKPVVRAGERGYDFTFGSKVVARVYQGYCCVAVLYSKAGAQKLIDVAKERGMYTPVDCFLYQTAHRGAVNGYAPIPKGPMPVEIDWQIPTTVQDTNRFDNSQSSEI